MNGVMVLGTASDVGKSLIATAICRALANEGYTVAPFKSQNMSNNSYVTDDGKEIGRAQGIQAEAARTSASVWMNPILLKPMSDASSEVVLFGTAIERLSGKDYRDSFYKKGLEAIESSLDYLQSHFDLVVMEGAGSPVEINLKDRELVNMKVAELADIPAILVADIDRGGVFASIVGTLELMNEQERSHVKGIIINKFRGDITLFEDGITWLEERCGIPVLGVLPYIDSHMIDGEDSLSIPQSMNNGEVDIAVLKPPYISNYTDLEPFYFEEDVSIRWVSRLADIGNPDAVILPGTKSTIRDLQYFRDEGFDEWLERYQTRGFIAGICGGYQMLGENLIDPDGADTGIAGTVEKGFGIIPADTTFLSKKRTVKNEGRLHHATGITLNQPISGYEIHLGETKLHSTTHSFLQLNNGEDEGYFTADGKVFGTYIHHIFHHDEWRNWWLNQIRHQKGLPARVAVYLSEIKDAKYDELADHLKKNIKWEVLKGIMMNNQVPR
ncbi:cobyric acid synthase [Cytobacillus horneckiae]|uniref:cobyric acid synthase n=1 Tax=Cytobacillus horneckiae TaxID=549687 RepID=UPI00203F39C2|nr:cobyric acid synthase [Cytobacillus horneckiae]MCM3180511.1 cobyric acid synthase [Cytobacillus horneckiae]